MLSDIGQKHFLGILAHLAHTRAPKIEPVVAELLYTLCFESTARQTNIFALGRRCKGDVEAPCKHRASTVQACASTVFFRASKPKCTFSYMGKYDKTVCKQSAHLTYYNIRRDYAAAGL